MARSFHYSKINSLLLSIFLIVFFDLLITTVGFTTELKNNNFNNKEIQKVLQENNNQKTVDKNQDFKADKNKDGVFIARNEIIFYTSIVQLLTIFISIAAIIFGAIVGINVYQGNKIIKNAKKELENIRDKQNEYKKEFDEIKENAENIYKEKIDKIRNEAEKVFESFIDNRYTKKVITPYKRQLFEELNKPNPDIKTVYVRLTEILYHIDENNLKIYTLCLEKFRENRDIIQIIHKGIKIISNQRSK